MKHCAWNPALQHGEHIVAPWYLRNSAHELREYIPLIDPSDDDLHGAGLAQIETMIGQLDDLMRANILKLVSRPADAHMTAALGGLPSTGLLKLVQRLAASKLKIAKEQGEFADVVNFTYWVLAEHTWILTRDVQGSPVRLCILGELMCEIQTALDELTSYLDYILSLELEAKAA